VSAPLLRFLAVLLFAIAPWAVASQSLEQRAQGLLGYWFAAGKDAAEARVLRVTNVIFGDSESVELAGLYGPASRVAWPEVRELTARKKDGRLALDVTLPDGTRTVLAAARDGTLQTAEGLRFSRSSLEQIQRFVALNPAPQARARRESVIELVYIGANDCTLCRAWEAAYLKQGKLAGSNDWPHLRFTEVKLATLRAPFKRDDLPERLRPRFDALIADGMRLHGVPAFVLLVDDTYRAQALGPEAFESFVYPALRAAVQEKLGNR
jgi:hypothetical protein